MNTLHFNGITFPDSSLCSLIFLWLLLTSQSYSQTDQPNFPPRHKVPELVSFFAPILFPKIIQDDYQLKAFIRSEEFAAFRKKYGDLNTVDEIFHEAMGLSWNNAYEALFLALVATMDHSKFGVRFPILGPLLWVPLTSEFADEFRARISALPRQLYADSPRDVIGDRDKLQHFFGSAFLTYVFESREPAERIGEFIELGEEAVIVDGVLDERDIRANRHGQEFGLRLLQDKTTLPSRFFQFALAQHDSQTVIVPDSAHDSVKMEKR